VKLGLVLPTFDDDADEALALATDAEAAGLDGVFAFDHLWPIGEPERPALAPFPVLAAVASRTERLALGPLVARIGLVGTTTLVARFATLVALAPGRVIAALGTGDRLSVGEEIAYGLPVLDASGRRALLAETYDAIAALDPTIPRWCGGGGDATIDVARRHGAEVNLWRATPERIRAASSGGPVSWSGPLGEDADATLDALAAAGATWAVSMTPSSLSAMQDWRRTH
jgi:alkanesulfonate monooxygenase SsuD/methylene tetrahydromethanopterin reductase-like flavin-dependent oxidoreductase (luciferase family)